MCENQAKAKWYHGMLNKWSFHSALNKEKQCDNWVIAPGRLSSKECAWKRLLLGSCCELRFIFLQNLIYPIKSMLLIWFLLVLSFYLHWIYKFVLLLYERCKQELIVCTDLGNLIKTIQVDTVSEKGPPRFSVLETLLWGFCRGIQMEGNQRYFLLTQSPNSPQVPELSSYRCEKPESRQQPRHQEQRVPSQ